MAAAPAADPPTGSPLPSLESILRARVYDVAIESPLEPARRLSQQLGQTILLKREDLQPVFSFKLRGAYNRMSSLTEDERQRGVICSSAGNHAQGVALAAEKLGVAATIVMPTTTPEIKVEAVERLGGTIVLAGDTYDDAQTEAHRRAREGQLTFIHPFDDADVIAGQGTIGMEILRQCSPPPAAVYVPIGGGGLAAGIALYIKTVHPEVQVVGVEPEDAASMTAAFEEGQPITLDHVGNFADGVAVRRVGDLTYRLCREHLDRIVRVGTDQTCSAIRDIFRDTRSIVEPAGALAVAGLLADGERPAGPLVALNCGANVNFDRLRHVAERADIGAQREALFGVEIPERPGSFLDFCKVLGERQVTEFNYRYSGPGTARIFVGVETGSPLITQQLVTALEGAGYPTTDLSADAMAKTHVRYMVGGTAALGDEVLYRFEFPERRGALLGFLERVGVRWNISLFHYRNHGSDFGRVLVGVQVPPADRAELARHLEQVGYPHWDESENPAYALFLARDEEDAS
ncbi:MAG: threonine ammonia-lyase, biosynthetic [Acidobacteriota bacterium]